MTMKDLRQLLGVIGFAALCAVYGASKTGIATTPLVTGIIIAVSIIFIISAILSIFEK